VRTYCTQRCSAILVVLLCCRPVFFCDAYRVMYAAGTAGAFVSEDKGVNWNALHVMISTTKNCTTGFSGCNHQVDRVQHDFQVRSN
jgi:hypothetical protein